MFPDYFFTLVESVDIGAPLFFIFIIWASFVFFQIFLFIGAVFKNIFFFCKISLMVSVVCSASFYIFSVLREDLLFPSVPLAFFCFCLCCFPLLMTLAPSPSSTGWVGRGRWGCREFLWCHVSLPVTLCHHIHVDVYYFSIQLKIPSILPFSFFFDSWII